MSLLISLVDVLLQLYSGCINNNNFVLYKF